MAHARPFWTSTLQEIFNGIKNASNRFVLPSTIELWSCGSPRGLQVPNFGSVSFILTLGQSGVATFDLSFGHNLCCKCPNESCEHILDIYISIAFQWHNFFLIYWVLTLAIALWTFESPPGLQLPMWEFPWECEGLFPHILLHFREHATWLLGVPLSPQPYNPLPWSWAQG
jgi:hypothetical protein